MKIERRYITGDEIETRSETSEDNKRYIMGYFAVKQANSVKITERINGELKTFTERIAPDAFDSSDLSDVIYTVEHDPTRPVARSGANLKISFNDKGLFARAEFPAESDSTTEQNDLIKNVNQGIIRGNSFAFRVEKDTWYRKDGELYRDINKIGKIVDITSTISPAYNDTYVFTRSLNEAEIVDVTETETQPETQPEPVPEPVVYDAETVDIDFKISLLKSKQI